MVGGHGQRITSYNKAPYTEQAAVSALCRWHCNPFLHAMCAAKLGNNSSRECWGSRIVHTAGSTDRSCVA